MRNKFAFAIVTVILLLASRVTVLAGGLDWAYGVDDKTPVANSAAPLPATNPPQTDTSLKSLPGSSLQFTRAQISDRFGPADWFPSDHPVMPDIVAHGKKPSAWACGLCHYPNGKGRSENAGVAGLPTQYFLQQLNDFRNGDRHSADPRKANTYFMIAIAKGLNEDEMKAAAEYFGSMKWTPWVKVVETETAPKTRNQGGLYLALDGNEKEPLGQRIIEVPDNAEATEVLRNPRSGFTAYAPVGSIKKGEALVTTGAGKTTQCGVCHGADLKGLGPVPSIAGRSPSYIARQLNDIQKGTRKGTWSQLMKPVVTGLSDEDILNIAAYVSSRTP